MTEVSQGMQTPKLILDLLLLLCIGIRRLSSPTPPSPASSFTSSHCCSNNQRGFLLRFQSILVKKSEERASQSTTDTIPSSKNALRHESRQQYVCRPFSECFGTAPSFSALFGRSENGEERVFLGDDETHLQRDHRPRREPPIFVVKGTHPVPVARLYKKG